MTLSIVSISRGYFQARLMPLFIFISFLYSCSSSDKEAAKLERFQVAIPLITDTTYIKEYVADIHSIQNVEIRAKVHGILEAIHVDEGQYVNEGQLLFTISGQQYQQELLKTQAALASTLADAKATEVELNNVKTLVDKNIVSQSELDLAQAKLDAAKAKIDEARAHEAGATLQLSFAQIRAPFNGIINRIPNKAGSLLEEGALLTTISNNKEVFAYFNLSEKDYLDYITLSPEEKSSEATLLLANNTLYQHKGKIETIESEFEKSTGNIAFRARFPNPNQILKHGGSGKILLTTSLKNVTLIPQKSTFEIQGNIYVFLVDKENKVQMRKVVPTHMLPHLYVISSGLSPDEKFIYEGIQRVREGDMIQSELVPVSQVVKK
jgi:RND family efflux transporter MFP subunit